MQIIDNIHAFFWQSTTANNCNTYLLSGPTPILIDPGHLRLFDYVRQGLDELGLALTDIGLVLCTHAHPDHIEAVQLFKQSGVPVAVHETEWEMIEGMKNQISAMGIDLEAMAPDFFLREGELTVEGVELAVFHTPGHSPGSTCLYLPEEKALFTGDLVFKDGLGRTDLPGGSGEQLKKSILRMASLDTDWLLPGHGNHLEGKNDIQRNFAALEQFYFAYV
ncbi:MAG: Zn-dependent hydrolase [Deltaproteobacteria bacterium SG8_13]|nr:MAG: Zn-dependent hydrolase [Deltaproteobacteria bacterium SG8_13]